MGEMASQITSLTIVYATVYSGTDQRKHQSSASLDFVRGIHRWPVNSPHKGPVTRKMFPFDDVIMRINAVSVRLAMILQWGKLQPHFRSSIVEATRRRNRFTQHVEAETKWPPCRRRHFQMHFLEWNVWNSIYIIPKFVPTCRTNNIPQHLVQIKAWWRLGDKSLFEPMMVSLPTHICVTRPQWVNSQSLEGYTFSSMRQ